MQNNIIHIRSCKARPGERGEAGKGEYGTCCLLQPVLQRGKAFREILACSSKILVQESEDTLTHLNQPTWSMDWMMSQSLASQGKKNWLHTL